MISTSHSGITGFAVSGRERDRIAFLRLRGTLDDRTVTSFKKSVFNIPVEKRVLVLDLSRLDQASNNGISALLDALRFFRKRNGVIFLVQPNEELGLLLQHFHAGDIAQVVRSYDEVLSQLPAGPAFSSGPDLESTITELQSPHGPAVHYHYYGKDLPVPEHAAASGVNLSLNDPLQELSSRLQHLQSLMEGQAGGSRDLTEKRIEEIAGAEGRMVDRLNRMEVNLRDSLNKGIDERLDRFEARVLDRLDPLTHLASDGGGSGRGAGGSQSISTSTSSFAGYRMVPCADCGSVLRIRRTGKHMCPACQREFSVNEKGEAIF